MLTLDIASYDAVVAHARRDHPDEACGVIALRAGQATRVLPITNVERSPTFHVMDTAELFAAMRSMRQQDEDDEDFVLYHSHTATEPYPSRTDVTIAGYPEAHYLVVSTRDPHVAEMRSFRIVDGEVTEEELRVVPAY